MRKVIVILIAIIFATISSASVNFRTLGKINERLLEMKVELQDELSSKEYENEVYGSFTVKGSKIILNTYMIPEANKKWQYKYGYSEVRSVDDFTQISTAKSYLPKYSYGSAKAFPFARTLGGIMALMLSAGMIIMTRSNRRKNRRKRIKEIYKKRNVA